MVKDEQFLKRLKIAWLGLIGAFKEEANFRIQSIIALAVVVFMFYLKVSFIEAAIVTLTMLVVLSLELINSQIEKFLDILHPDLHPRVKVIKDFSAGAVLLSAIASVVIGVLIFSKYIF